MNERMRKAVVWVMIAGFVALVAVGIAARFLRPGSLPALTKADRAPLVDTVVAGRRVLEHPTLGFSFSHPGDGWSVSTELVDGMHKSQPDPRFHFYAYAAADQSGAIMIAMANEAVKSRDEMQRQLNDFERELRKGAMTPGMAELQIVSDGVLWDATRREAQMHATQGEAHYRGRLLVLRPKGHPPVLIAFMTIALDPQALTDVLASLTP